MFLGKKFTYAKANISWRENNIKSKIKFDYIVEYEHTLLIPPKNVVLSKCMARKKNSQSIREEK